MKQREILIVDDIELNRAILCELFRESYEILEAEDGLSALRIIRERQDSLAVVLLDILMPVLDGFGVLEGMRAEGLMERLPVIMITAENSENVALRGYELGVADIINKPFSPSVVHRRVENVISLYQYRFQLERIVDQQNATLARLSNARPHQPSAGDSHRMPPENLPAKSPSISKRVLWLLELEREKYRLLSEMSGDIVFSYDLQEDVIDFTENYQKVFGGETKYRQFSSYFDASEKIPAKDKEALRRKVSEKNPQESNNSVRVRIETISGHLEWFEIYLNALWNKETGQCAGYIGKIININAMKAEAEHWREEAYRDPLTALYNRKAVEELSSQLLPQQPDGGRQAVLFFVDIDNFKQLNDQLGHLYGDEVLRYVGREMHRQFRTSDIVGRIGGDEFVVLMNSIFSREDIMRKADELCTIFREAPCPAKLAQPISGSIGIACSPGDGKDYQDLLHKADIALYYAKSQGKNRYAFYTDQL